MPEASVNEYRDFLAREGEIWVAHQLVSPPPPFDFMLAEQANDNLLR